MSAMTVTEEILHFKRCVSFFVPLPPAGGEQAGPSPADIYPFFKAPALCAAFFPSSVSTINCGSSFDAATL